jgi:hypothetical protein
MQAIYNYGSALQTYATYTFFNEKGLETEIIDYYPQRIRNYGSFLQLYRNAKPFHRNPLKCIIVALVNMPSNNLQKKVFTPFLSTHFEKTRKYLSHKELMAHPPIADIYCTGSDQVWNDFLEGEFDLAYFLSFAPKGKKRIAYAASFGRDNITEEELLPAKQYLEQYDAISVREKTGLDILSNIKVNYKECILDPTFMLTKEKWEKLMGPVKEKKYILVYQLHEDSAVAKLGNAVGRELGLSVIRISTALHKRIKGGKTVLLPKVEEFISYINEAELIVTDSFHATAFSIILNKKFISVRWKMFNSRIQTLLQKVGLEYRLVSTVKEALGIKDRSIDYQKVNEIIDEERIRTKDFIRRAIEA